MPKIHLKVKDMDAHPESPFLFYALCDISLRQVELSEDINCVTCDVCTRGFNKQIEKLNKKINESNNMKKLTINQIFDRFPSLKENWNESPIIHSCITMYLSSDNMSVDQMLDTVISILLDQNSNMQNGLKKAVENSTPNYVVVSEERFKEIHENPELMKYPFNKLDLIS